MEVGNPFKLTASSPVPMANFIDLLCNVLPLVVASDVAM